MQAYDKPPTILIDSLPPDDWHGSKYLRFGPDGKLYFAVGEWALKLGLSGLFACAGSRYLPRLKWEWGTNAAYVVGDARVRNRRCLSAACTKCDDLAAEGGYLGTTALSSQVSLSLAAKRRHQLQHLHAYQVSQRCQLARLPVWLHLPNEP